MAKEIGVGKSDAKSDLSTLYTAYQLYQNWGNMSAAQKAQAIASLGLQGYKFGTGEDLGNAVLIKGTTSDASLSLGEAFGLFSTGYNVYALANNWKQLNSIQKITNGIGTASQVGLTAKNLGLIGVGNSGAAVSATAEGLSQAGWKAASNYGIGAISGPLGSQIPAGYTTLGTGASGTIAIPTGNLASGLGAIGAEQSASQVGTISGQYITGNAPAFGLGAEGGGALASQGAAQTSTFANGLQIAGGAASFAAGAYAVYKGWGTGGAQGATQGAIGGAGMAAGLSALSSPLGVTTLSNPYLLSAVIAVSILGNTVKTGKSKDQGARDSIRGFIKERGIVDDKYQLTLADGSTFDLGIDGHGGLHTVRDPSKVLKGMESRAGKDKLNAYDIDVTNDLDYIAGMGGISLTRLLGGGKAKSIDQLGSQIGNGVLSSVGYGKDLTQENYQKVINNLRAVYSKAGIKSKADGYQLANQMFAEHRIDDSDHTAMMQALNMIYDDKSFYTAQSLMSGRFRGVEVLGDSKDDHPDETVEIEGANADPNDTPIIATQPGTLDLKQTLDPKKVKETIAGVVGNGAQKVKTDVAGKTEGISDITLNKIAGTTGLTAENATELNMANVGQTLGSTVPLQSTRAASIPATKLNIPGSAITPNNSSILQPAENTFSNPPPEFKNLPKRGSYQDVIKRGDNLSRGDMSQGATAGVPMKKDGTIGYDDSSDQPQKLPAEIDKAKEAKLKIGRQIQAGAGIA